MKINHLIIEITQFNFVHWRIKRGFRGMESSPYSGAYGFKENVMSTNLQAIISYL